jgi:FKBP-type peptidyl-prolyl cis-trans isomerase (trigger factor)
MKNSLHSYSLPPTLYPLKICAGLRKYSIMPTVKILAQKRDKNTVVLEIEAERAALDKSYEKALVEAGNEIRLPGFRPGKAPRKMIEGALNLQAVEQHAAQELISELYPAVLAETKIEPVDYPSVEIVQMAKDKPFLFKLTVEVYPEVKLGKYKGLKLEKQPTEVSEADVLAALGRLQERVSTADAEGKKVLQPLDDEFAKKVSRYGTLAELKAELLRAMSEEKIAEAEADLRNQAIAAAGADAKLEIPQAMIERETDVMLDELKTSLAQSGLTLEQYLQGAKKEEQVLRDELKNPAEIRVKGKLILKAVAAAEKLTVTPDEMAAEIKTMAEAYGQQADAAEKQLNEGGRAYIEEYLLRKKALDWLIEQAAVKEAKQKEAKS